MHLARPLLHALARMSLGGIILDGSGSVIDFNAVTLALFQIDENGTEPASAEAVRRRLKALLREGESRFSLNENAWVLSAQEGKRPLAIYALPVGDADDSYGRTIVILVDLERTPQPGPATLQRLFGLTPAEATLALQIAAGATPSEVARQRGVKLTTVRSQLASVFNKTRTRRQAELVALTARIAILP